MQTVEEAIEAIEKFQADPDIRVNMDVPIGKRLHQGDVYFYRVPDDHPRGKLLATKQVAVGENVGARHIVDGDGFSVYEGKAYPNDFKEPEWVEEGALLGPLVVLDGDVGRGLTHPEHADHIFGQGCYQVTYQADAKTKRRVKD